MFLTPSKIPYTCFRCLRTKRQRHASSIRPWSSSRWISSNSPLAASESESRKVINEDAASIEAQISKVISTSSQPSESQPKKVPEQGAMSRRLSEATEDALMEGGRAGRKAVEEAGFSDELKARLLERVEAQKFHSENAAAFAEANLSTAAGRGTRDIATGQAWTGIEAPEDTVLRMLSDAHKPLKPGLRAPSKLPVVDLRINREPKRSSGQRLANARDKTSIYAIAKDNGMSEKEREAMRKEFKERFTPSARSMPNSIRGLQALANERIEDAIARGQFKNIPRGKGVLRDARADNPFIDTTEYLMNKMIKRQDIVPPWIEKQQELVKIANVFRARLRNDWKRHAARTISSRGGSLTDQIRTADRYAESEKAYNPRRRSSEQISVPTNLTSDPVMISITQEASKSSKSEAITPVIQVSMEQISEKVAIIENSQPQPSVSLITSSNSPTSDSPAGAEQSPKTTSLPDPPPTPLPLPFRDSIWEQAELAYLKLAIKNLNNITRSYNLMAPSLAKKPYFSLERELLSCYADVAPQVGLAIRERAAKPARELVEKVGHRPGGMMERFKGDEAKVYDSKKPQYGLKEFWSDLWRGEKGV